MGLAVVSPEAFVHALDGAHSLQLSAYTLGSATQGASRVIAALEAAADRGADVHVRLESNPYDPSGAGGLAQANRDAVGALRAHGVDATLSDDPNAPLHMKAAIVDGTLFLNDRNWPDSGEVTIVTTRDADDVETVRKAFDGEHAVDGHLATWKRRALELEVDTIHYAPPGAVDVETESFGPGIVLDALAARLRAGDPVRLLVAARDLAGNAREAGALRQLAAAG
ncbi:MAG TPA: hypothetical protein VME66_01540, partial [Candidatus Acidoferrales bacterium]|nr:hypothetical protein [Candidatus Acidoferrales bacterium]